MTDNWGFYERHTAEDHMRVLVNTGYEAALPLAEFADLLSITINLYPVRAHSGNTRQFVKQLEALESKLEQWLKSMTKAIYIGRINAATKLEFYYYLPVGELSRETLNEWLGDHWPHRAQSYIKSDPDWEFYRFLLPNGLEQLFVHNAQMIYALIHKGDRIAHPRKVFHWLLFREEKDRSELTDLLNQQGYSIEKEQESRAEEDYPYPLVISRYEDVRLDTVNARVRDLYRLLGSRDARYEGWGSAMKLSIMNRFRRYMRRRKEAAYSILRKIFTGKGHHSQSKGKETGNH